MSTDDRARDRILLTAAELFADEGYRNVSIRKICETAKVNVSMVNYYFRSKEELYSAVFEFARSQRVDVLDTDSVPLEPAAAKERLRGDILKLLHHFLADGQVALLTRLIGRALIEPSPMLQDIASTDVSRVNGYFAALVRAIVGVPVTDYQAQRCAFSIIGQAIFYVNSRPLHELATPPVDYSPHGIEQIADHIYSFTLTALEGMYSRRDVSGSGAN